MNIISMCEQVQYIHVGEYENSKADQMRRQCVVCVYVSVCTDHKSACMCVYTCATMLVE